MAGDIAAQTEHELWTQIWDVGHQPRPPLSLQRYTHPQPPSQKKTYRASIYTLSTHYLGGGDRVVPVRGGVHALPHLLHPARLPGQGRGRQNIT